MKRNKNATKGLKKKSGSWWLGSGKISRCIYAASLTWYAQMHCDSGFQRNEENCPQFRTLREARRWIERQWRLEDQRDYERELTR